MICDYCEIVIREDTPNLQPVPPFLQRVTNGRVEYYCSHECARRSMEWVREKLEELNAT